jgi:hypothetical protein
MPRRIIPRRGVNSSLRARDAMNKRRTMMRHGFACHHPQRRGCHRHQCQRGCHPQRRQPQPQRPQRHHTCVMWPDDTSLATPAGNGAIGVARETPTPAAKMKAATAIANAVRIMLLPPMDELHGDNTKASSQFHNAAFHNVAFHNVAFHNVAFFENVDERIFRLVRAAKRTNTHRGQIKKDRPARNRRPAGGAAAAARRAPLMTFARFQRARRRCHRKIQCRFARRSPRR